MTTGSYVAPGQAYMTFAATIANRTFDIDTLHNQYSPCEQVSSGGSVTIGAGNNTITIPAKAQMVLVEAPASNATAWTVKGVAGDTGTAQNPNGIFFQTFATTPPASFVINAGSTITGMRITWM